MGLIITCIVGGLIGALAGMITGKDFPLGIVGNVIACVEVRLPVKVVYESRIRFHIEDNRMREEIIRYIFEEERKVRQKENG